MQEQSRLIREFVQMVIADIETKPGAGIIVVKRFTTGWKVLSLESLDGIMDIPKGAIDEGEFPLEAALRETEEEAGITKLDFAWGLDHIVNGKITCYVAKTEEEPVISANPHTHIIEHVNHSWVDWNYIEQNTYEFLKPCIRWAKEIVENEVTCIKKPD